ncbi:MAG: histidine kinase, partial [Telluria sp.]
KEIADENERLNLELRTANHDLATANRRMEELLLQKQLQIKDNEVSLSVARELLQFIPLAVIGLDEDGMVAFINGAAEAVFAQCGAILGNEAASVLPELFPGGLAPSGTITTCIGAQRYQAVAHSMGSASRSRGTLITLSPCEAPA